MAQLLWDMPFDATLTHITLRMVLKNNRRVYQAMGETNGMMLHTEGRSRQAALGNLMIAADDYNREQEKERQRSAAARREREAMTEYRSAENWR